MAARKSTRANAKKYVQPIEVDLLANSEEGEDEEDCEPVVKRSKRSIKKERLSASKTKKSQTVEVDLFDSEDEKETDDEERIEKEEEVTIKGKEAAKGRVTAQTTSLQRTLGGKLFEMEAEESEGEGDEEDEESEEESQIVFPKKKAGSGITKKDVCQTDMDKEKARAQGLNQRHENSGSFSSPASVPSPSSSAGVRGAVNLANSSSLWALKNSPAATGRAGSGGSVSRLAPGSTNSRRRITRMFTTIVQDGSTHLLLAIFVSNAYDRAQFLNGSLDYEGGKDSAKLVKFPMRLFYTNARNSRFNNFPCESPACLRNHYPTYVAIGFDADYAITEANSALLQALYDQFMAVIDGSDDLSNNATYSVVATTVDADENMLKALIALSEISLLKGSGANNLGDGPAIRAETRAKRDTALALNGFYAFHPRPMAAVWNILEITFDLANERMVLIGDHLVSINGRDMLQYTDDEVEVLMVSALQGNFVLAKRSTIPNRISNRIQQSAMALSSIGFTAGRPEGGCVNRPIRVTSVARERNHDCVVGDVVVSINHMQILPSLNQIDINAALASASEIVTISADKARRIRVRQNQFLVVAQHWDYERPCVNCGYICLKSMKNRKICCLSGRATDPTYFPPLWPLPPYLKALAIDRIEHMGPRSSYYNSVLALGATGVDNGKGGGWEKIRGNHAVKLNGRTYHYIPTTGSNCKAGIQYFTYDAATQMEEYAKSLNRPSVGQNGERTIQQYLRGIYNELKDVNELVNECDQIGIMAGSAVLVEGDARDLRIAINVQTSAFDIAAITSDATTGERILTYKLKGQNRAKTIPITHGLLEPLSYPLLFPYGEHGWSADIRKTLGFSQYLRSRMLMPERDFEGNLLTLRNKLNTRDWPVNRFQLMSRVGQIYLTDMLSRGIDYRLHWYKRNQRYIFEGSNSGRRAQDDNNDDANEFGENSLTNIGEGEEAQYSDSKSTFLGQAHHGGRRHLRKLATNAITIVSEHDNPTLFLTMTCNPLWPEIVEALLPGQTAFDRPDICTQVFHQRLEAFLINLRAGKYFDSEDDFNDCTVRRKIIYEIRVIEYQHRGLPHTHIIIKLSDTPHPSDHAACSIWVDTFLSCILPDNIDDSSTAEDQQYFDIVSKHLIHK